MLEKIFCGSGKRKTVELADGRSFEAFTINVEVSKLQEHANEKGYVNLKIGDRKTEDKFKNNMFVEIDTWKPEGSNQSTDAKEVFDKSDNTF